MRVQFEGDPSQLELRNDSLNEEKGALFDRLMLESVTEDCRNCESP